MSAPFVEVAWLAEHLDDPRVRIVDTRSMPHGANVEQAPTAASNTPAGTSPGAVHLDYAEDLHDLATPYAARVAPPERFAEVMGANGIGDGTRVIAYDEGDVPVRCATACGCCATTVTTTSRFSPAASPRGPPPATRSPPTPGVSARDVHAARAAGTARVARRRDRRGRRPQRRAVARNATRRHLRAARSRHSEQHPPLGERRCSKMRTAAGSPTAGETRRADRRGETR